MTLHDHLLLTDIKLNCWSQRTS